MNERWQLAEWAVWAAQGWHTVDLLKQVAWPQFAWLGLGAGRWAETAGIVAGLQTAACVAGAVDGSEFVHMLENREDKLSSYVQWIFR